MKVITLLNEKGGVGKTTLSTHIAAGLGIKGYRTLLIDTDPQANATVTFNLPEEPGLYDIMVRNKAWKDVLRRAPQDVFMLENQPSPRPLFVLPSNIENRAIPMVVSQGSAILLRRIAELANLFDFVIFDTSPTPSNLHEAIMVSSDWVLLPTELEAYSAFKGLADSLMHTGEVREGLAQKGFNRAVPLGIIPMMYRKKTVSHNTVLRRLRADYQDLVWSPVDQAICFGEAALIRKLLFALDADLNATAQMWEIVERIEMAAKVSS